MPKERQWVYDYVAFKQDISVLLWSLSEETLLFYGLLPGGKLQPSAREEREILPYFSLLGFAALASRALYYLYCRSVTKCAIQHLPGPPAQSFATGNMKQLFTPNGMDFHYKLWREYGSVSKIHGLFGDEQLYISDPRALEHILVRDQYIFEETPSFIIKTRAMFGEGLLSTIGERHRRQRKMLNPVFAPSNLRELVPVFYHVADKLRDVIHTQITNGATEIDMLYWMSRAALEYVGVGALGYSFQALDDNADNTYMKATQQLLPALYPLNAYRQIATFVASVAPLWLQRLIVAYLPSRRLQTVRMIIGVMDSTSREIYLQKKRGLLKGEQEELGNGKDMMSILLRANMHADEKDRLPEYELIAQMNTLIFAAHDTTSSSLSRMLYQLAMDPERQHRLRKEIREARALYSNMDYERLMALPYLDAVCKETLRLYPPVTIQQRTATKDISIPLHYPVTLTTGKQISSIPVRKNQTVLIGITAINRKKELWGADADDWRPERWLEPLPEALSEAKVPGVYSHLMTFIGGGRACIGFKFSELEIKVALSVLLETFVFSPSDADIIWRLGSVQTPCVKGREREPAHMPLKVSLAT